MVGTRKLAVIDGQGSSIPPTTARHRTEEFPAQDSDGEWVTWGDEVDEYDDDDDWDSAEIDLSESSDALPSEPSAPRQEVVDADQVILDDQKPEPEPVLVLAADGQEQRFPLGDLNVIIGRSPSADIVTTGDGVALFHVRIEPLDDGRHRVIDLDARSGTLRNGEPIEEAVLEPGDRLLLGDTELFYRPQPRVSARKRRVVAALPASSPGPLDSMLMPVPSESGLMPIPGELRSPPARRPGTRMRRPVRKTTQRLAVSEEPDTIERLARLVVFGRRYYLLLIFLPLLGLLAGALSLQVLPPAMVAQFELSLVQSPTDNPTETSGRRSLTFFRSARDNFLGPQLIGGTLASLGEAEPDPERIEQTKRRLSFDRTSQFIYHGRYEAPDRDEATRFLQAHLDRFLETEIDKAIKVLNAEVDTLRGELAEVDHDLTEVETARAQFRHEAGVAQPEHAAELQRRLESLRDDRRSAARAADQMGASVNIAQKRVGSEDKVVEIRIEDAKPFSEQIAATEQALIDARASGQGPLHPNVKSLEARLAGLEDRHQELLDEGAGRMETRSNPAYAKAKLSLHEARSLQKVARADLARTNSEIDRIEGALDELPEHEAKKAALDRRYKSLTARHEDLQLRLGHSELQLALERRQVEARFDLVQPPTAEPHSPQQTVVLRAGAGTLAGLLLALLICGGHQTWERVGQHLEMVEAEAEDAEAEDAEEVEYEAMQPMAPRFALAERPRPRALPPNRGTRAGIDPEDHS